MPKKKPGTKKAQSPPANESKDANKPSEEEKEAARKRAAAGRAAVSSSASWTGKLPGSLLQEHCQKLKWEKVTFDCKRVPEGFIITAVLGQKNPKTRETEYVKLQPPTDLVPPQETPLEARHFAATYALHRVASHKNLKMVLPGPHKQLWMKLDDVKKSCKDKEYWYAEDPFTAARDRKSRLENQKSPDVVEKKEQMRLKSAVRQAQQEIRSNKEDADGNENEPAPRIRYHKPLSMERDTRFKVERLIRKYGGFEMIQHPASSLSVDKRQLLGTCVKLGFGRAQAKEALEYCSSLSDALEWLLIHMPEDDLPQVFQRAKNASSHATKQSTALTFEYAVREIKSFGYGEELVREFLTANEQDKYETLGNLTQILAGVQSGAKLDNIETTWTEECEGIAVLHDNAKFDEFKIVIDEEDICIHIWKTQNYPNSLPGIGVESKKSLSKIVLLTIAKRTAATASEYLGDCMLAIIAETAKEEYQNALKEPCTLCDISPGVIGVAPGRQSLIVESQSKLTPQSRNTKESSRRPSKPVGERKVPEVIDSRKSLPAWNARDTIVDCISLGRATLITGETGSGKSTQVVQFLWDQCVAKGEPCNIICTQPRRISAMGLAQRVATERGTSVGEQVGYTVRGENKCSSATSIRFVTTGVLLRMLRDDAQMVNNLTHIVVDEVHERSVDVNFLLVLLRRLSRSGKIRLVLMSATVDITAFENYFDNSLAKVHIPGRTFPVEDVYLDELIPLTDFVPEDLRGKVKSSEVGKVILSMKDRIVDYELITHVVAHANQQLEEGSVLVFMSGTAEIDNCISALRNISGLWPLPLHASLPPQEQMKVFDPAPKGKRKVVVSTNVAETSITIEDVVAVVDTGRVKKSVFDPEANVVRLVDTFASVAEVTQRRGRAGRVRKGVCYKLYTSKSQSEFEKEPAPEIKRIPLEQLYLAVASMQVGDPQRFLNEGLDPPEISALNTAKKTLIEAGAVDQDGKLTALGKHVATIPADIRTAKLLVLGTVFGFMDLGLTLAAVLAAKSPFISPRDKREEAKTAMQGFDDRGQGDIMAICNAYHQWVSNRKGMGRKQLKAWAGDNFLSLPTLFEIHATRRQFEGCLREIGFIGDKQTAGQASLNANGANMKLIQAVVAAAMTPNLIEIVFPQKTYRSTGEGTVELDPEAKQIKFFSQNQRVFVHPGSLLFGESKFVGDAQFLSYGSKMATSKLFVNQLTPAGSYGVLFFANSITVDALGSGIVLNDQIGFKCWPRVGILVKALQALFSRLLDAKFNDPQMDLQQHDILQLAIALIQTEGKGH